MINCHKYLYQYQYYNITLDLTVECKVNTIVTKHEHL